jgi:hypothetical protein
MMQIFDCDQNSPEWYACRLGIPTASMFATVLAKGKDGGVSLTRKTYLYKLAGEIITGDPMDNFSNDHMQRGKDMEDEARNLYAFMTDAIPQRIGFVRNGQKGCSPDSFIGTAGALEVKTKLAHMTIECLLRDEFPPEHKAQCQGALWVCEREWIDIAVYWPKLPLFTKRAYRDEAYISRLSDAVDQFNEELASMVERVKRYGMPMSEAA